MSLNIPPIHPTKIYNNPKTGTVKYSVRSSSREKPSFIDKYFMKYFVMLVPNFILPNYITIFRFLTIPFIIYFLLQDNYKVGLILFAISAFSDAVDGSVARMRKQITDWGKLFDPLADKLLIGSVAVIVITKFLNIYLAGIIVAIAVCLVAYNIFFRGRRKKVISARFEGKIKMILQCVGIGLLLLNAISPAPVLLTIASWILYFAVLFGALSLFVYRTI